MFAIFKNNRKTKTLYPTYEAARQTLRKRLRKVTSERHKGQPSLPMWTLGYEIRRV